MIAAAVATLVVVWAAPAAAHVDVTADKTEAGATDVTLTFTAESESSSAGVVSLRVVLPAGIVPAEVTYVSGPSGWKLTRTPDGYTVAGPAVGPGRPVTYTVRIAQLPPDATSLSFRTLQTYTNGEVDRWIEVPREGSPEPDNPAPTLRLTAVATSTSATATTPPTTAPVATTGPAPATPTATDTSTGSSGWWWLLLVAVLLVGAGVLLWWRRRRPAGAGPEST